jgi:hypothetical protein
MIADRGGVNRRCIAGLAGGLRGSLTSGPGRKRLLWLEACDISQHVTIRPQMGNLTLRCCVYAEPPVPLPQAASASSLAVMRARDARAIPPRR